MKFMEETLLEKAKKVVSRKKRNEQITDEHIGLAIAWAEGIINLKQVSTVLKLKSGGTLGKLSSFLRAGFAKGKIKKT